MLPGALLLFRKKDAGRAEKIWITLLVVLYWVMSAAGRHHQRGAIDKHARSPEVYVARGEFLEMYVPSRTGSKRAWRMICWRGCTSKRVGGKRREARKKKP